MAEQEITQEELNERVAILRRFRMLLEQQRKKFQDYLNLLEKQETCIENEDTEALVAHAELEQEVVKGIANLQKVIVPMSEMYNNCASSMRSSDRNNVELIQNDLSRLQARVLEKNAKNRELIRSHLVEFRNQLSQYKNPYKNISSIYAKQVAQGNLVAVEA